MLLADTPSNEAERLQALQALDILDTPPEERFDRLTRLAQRALNVPIALISLVDAERQWFKSRIGLEARETPRDIAFCAHAVCDGQTLIVEDALNDKRFADNPLVFGEPNIRFYAGFPLHSDEGYLLGTLCVIDRQPRVLEPTDQAFLQQLATLADKELRRLRESTTDPLTGVSSRHGFYELVDTLLGSSQHSMLPATLLCLDIEDFRDINRHRGQEGGDQVLRELVSAIKQNFRGSDLIGRLGADEFGILLPACPGQAAKRKADDFRHALRCGELQQTCLADVDFKYSTLEYSPARHGNAEQLMVDLCRQMYWQKDCTALGQRRDGRRQ